jgi:hypothetical protein
MIRKSGATAPRRELPAGSWRPIIAIIRFILESVFMRLALQPAHQETRPTPSVPDRD